MVHSEVGWGEDPSYLLFLFPSLSCFWGELVVTQGSQSCHGLCFVREPFKHNSFVYVPTYSLTFSLSCARDSSVLPDPTTRDHLPDCDLPHCLGGRYLLSSFPAFALNPSTQVPPLFPRLQFTGTLTFSLLSGVNGHCWFDVL